MGKRASLGVASVALVAKLAVAVQLAGHPLLQPSGVLDDAVYVALARRVLQGDVALGPDVYFVSPFYIYFLAAALGLTGGSLLAVRLVQAALGAAAVWLVAETGRRVFGERAGLAAGVLAALLGILTFNEILLLQSAVDPFLTALALFLLARALEPAARSRLAIAAGLSLGLLAMNRPNALAAAAVCAVSVALAGRTRRDSFRAVAVAAGIGVALLPVALRNRMVAGDWVLLSSHGGLNFYIGNNAQADGTYHSVPGIAPTIEGQARDARRVAETARGRPLRSSEVSDYFYARAFDWIRAEPAAALRLLVRKAAYVLNHADIALNFSYSYFAEDERTLLRALVVGPGLLVPIGLVGLFTPRRGEAPRPYAAWAAFAPAYVVSVAVFFVSSRYRLPLWVALCVSGGAALARLAELAGTRRWRELAWLAAAIAVLAFVANRDLGLDEGRSNQRTEMIVHLIDAGRRQEAQALLEKTEAEHPRRALLYYRVGRAFQDRREWAPALDSMGKALALEPAQPDVHYSVGLVLLQSGRASEAVAHLEAAEGAEGVAPAERDYQLACALAEAGRLDQAREALERVVAAGARGVAESWLEVGGLALRLQAPTLAEAAFRKAVEAAPAAAAAYEGLGLALGYQERLDEAERHLAEACRLDASGASARLNLAVLLARRGRLEDARARAQEALRLRPDYQQARALLGQLEALAGPRR